MNNFKVFTPMNSAEERFQQTTKTLNYSTLKTLIYLALLSPLLSLKPHLVADDEKFSTDYRKSLNEAQPCDLHMWRTHTTKPRRTLVLKKEGPI